jgi:two-component system, cell cycle sensor histidine kinase PleC
VTAPAKSGVIPEGVMKSRSQKTLPKTGTLQDAIFNSAHFSSIATDPKGVIQMFNVGARRMLVYTVQGKVTRPTLGVGL